MDILICTASFPPQSGGVSHVVEAHARGLAERGHRVTVATARDPERSEASYPRGMEVVSFDVSGNAHPRSRYRGDTGAYINYVGDFRGDLICCHCWQTWATDLAVRGFPGTRAKKVLVSHGVSANTRFGWPRTLPAWILWRTYVLRDMPRILEAFDHLVTLSGRSDGDRFYDRRLAERLGYRHLSVIPNGVDLRPHRDAPTGFRERAGIRTSRMVLSVGAYYDLKNQRLALDAFIDLMPEDTTLVFIGQERTSYSARLERRWERARRPDSSSRVVFLDNLTRDEILSAYATADVFLCPSRTECFPLVILDAMASETAFVSTDVGCVADLPGGVVVRTREEMAHRIGELLGDEAQRKAMGSLGRRACETIYCWPKVIDAYEALFQRLSEGGGQSGNR